jgi:hypothetical protein
MRAAAGSPGERPERNGANPAANAALTDAAYVAGRFRVVQHRLHV